MILTEWGYNFKNLVSAPSLLYLREIQTHKIIIITHNMITPNGY